MSEVKIPLIPDWYHVQYFIVSYAVYDAFPAFRSTASFDWCTVSWSTGFSRISPFHIVGHAIADRHLFSYQVWCPAEQQSCLTTQPEDAVGRRSSGHGRGGVDVWPRVVTTRLMQRGSTALPSYIAIDTRISEYILSCIHGYTYTYWECQDNLPGASKQRLLADMPRPITTSDS